MNIYNWILPAASPWSDEYHSLFIRPPLIFLNPASITAGCGAEDDNDDDDDSVNRGKLKWSGIIQWLLNNKLKSLEFLNTLCGRWSETEAKTTLKVRR